MKLLENVLVPIDINTNSQKQIDSAIKIASAYKSKITLLYVVPDTELKESIKQILLKSATELLLKVKATFENQGITVDEPIIEFGNIVKSIVKCAKSHDANLVIIGENEENKRKKYKLSAKSEQVIRALDVPVFFISENNVSTLTNILCPVDFSPPSLRALRNSIAFAKAFNANLTVLYVFEPVTYVSPYIDVDLSQENKSRLDRANNEMKAFIKDVDFKDINYAIKVVSGNANETILNTIKDIQIDLLIMGTNGRTGLSAFIMGNVTQSVIREIPCSFLTVKKINFVGTNKASYD